MRAKSFHSQNPDWLKYGGVLLLGLVFIVFLGVLLFSSISNPLGGKCVAVVTIDQEITTAGSPAGLFSTSVPGSEEIASAIEDINERDDVGAVVFVMDSPGGSVVGSQEIYRAVKSLNKPKVAYFREVAASGAYYIAAGTDYIISEPTALTGSIGVIMTLSDMSGLFEKIGYNMTAIKSGESKDIGSSARPLTEKERAILQSLVDEIFQDFKSLVLTERGSKLNSAKFNEILDGRVVSGRQAEEIGLVDEIGTKKDAIRKAAELAGMDSEEPSICEISTSSSSNGLFDARSLLAGLLSEGNDRKVSLKYE